MVSVSIIGQYMILQHLTEAGTCRYLVGGQKHSGFIFDHVEYSYYFSYPGSYLRLGTIALCILIYEI